MALLSALNLKEPRNGFSWRPVAKGADVASAVATRTDTARADRLKAELDQRMKDTIALAKGLSDPRAKAELAATLQAADAQRKKANSSGNIAERAQAYEATLAKVNAAAAQAQAKAPVANGAGAKLEAAALRPKIEKQQAETRAAYDRLAPSLAQVEDEIKAAKADKSRKAELPALEEKKKKLDDQMAPIERHLEQLDADAKALDDPRSTAKTFNDILARQNSGAIVLPQMQTDKHDNEIEKKRTENKETRVQTSSANGKSTTRTEVDKETVGVDGYTKSKSDTTETVRSDGTQSTDSTSSTTTVGKDGIGHDKTTKKETTGKDGRTSSTEDKTSIKVGPDGASRSDSSTQKNADGSGSTQSSSVGVERGKGKAGVTTSSSASETDAGGNSTSVGGKSSKGMSAGKDGIGAYADNERSVEHKRANGMKAGLVGGLNANVVCNIVPKDGDPPSYELSVSINLGVRVGASAGRDKEGAVVSGGVTGGASKAVSMSRRYVLAEAEAQAYVASLKAASAGGGGGTQQEFAIIRTGVSNKGWDAAREMYLAMSGKALDKNEVDKLEKGESIEVTKSDKVGVDANLGAKGKGIGIGVGIEGGVESSHDQSTKVTREQDGSVTYDTKDSNANKLSGGAKLNVGVVEGGMTLSKTQSTSTGYKISVDPKADNAAEMQAALARCKSQADLDQFAARYPQAVKEKTKGKGKAENTGATLGVGPVKAGIGFGTSNEEEVTVDKDGKFVKKVVKGGNQGSDELAIGKFKIGSKSEEQAVAEIDADGNATLDTSKADTSTNTAKWLEANVPGAGNKKDKGLLKQAGGEPEDTDDHDIKGIKLNSSNLAAIGRLACNDAAEAKWWDACAGTSDLKDWEAARDAIRAAGGNKAVVAQELAKFVGKDNSRARVIESLARPSSSSTAGSRYAFPGGLASSRQDYDSLVIAEAELRLDKIASDDGNPKAIAAGEQMLAALDKLDRSVGSAQDFSDQGIRGEMLAAIRSRAEKVRAKLRVLKGGKADELSIEERDERYGGLIDNCVRHKFTETACFEKIAKTHKGGKPNLDETIANVDVIRQLQELYATWDKDYAKLAEMAQEYGYGADRYWKYKPDRKRFNRAKDGAPGEASEPEPETKDYRKKVVKEEPRDPVGDADRDLQKKVTAKEEAIANSLPESKAKAVDARDRLKNLIDRNRKPDAVEAYEAGLTKMEKADADAKLAKTPADMSTYGYFAMNAYEAAASRFEEGIALYPATKKKQPDTLQSTRHSAYETGNRLFAWIQTDCKPAALQAHNRGMAQLKKADADAKQVKADQDMPTLGRAAINAYNQAAAYFGDGLALYPRGMPKA